MKVQEYSQFGFGVDFIRTVEGQEYITPLQIPVSNVKTHVETETLNSKVCTITNTGKIASISGVGVGKTTVKAKLVATQTNTVQAEAEMMVIVEKAADQLTYITTTKTVHILEKGMTKDLAAELRGEGIVVNDKYNLQWKSSDEKIVKLLGASTTGIATGDMIKIQAVAPGDAVITVSHEKVNTNLTIKVNVPETAETQISLNKTYIKIEKTGSNAQAELKAILRNATPQDYNTIEWTADKENGLDIVKVMGSGQTVYIFPIEINKKTKVRAKLPNGNEAVCDVEVVSGRQFNFKTKTITVKPGESKTIDYIFEPKDGHLNFQLDKEDVFTFKEDRDTQQLTITGMKVGNGKLVGISESGNATLSVVVDWQYSFSTTTTLIDGSPSDYKTNPNRYIINYTVTPEFADVRAELNPDRGTPRNFARINVERGEEKDGARRGKIFVILEKEGSGTLNIIATNPDDNDKEFRRTTCHIRSQEAEVQIKLKDLKSNGNFSRIDTDAEGNSSLVISDGERVDFKIDSNVELKDLKVEYVPNELSNTEGVRFSDEIYNFQIKHPNDYREDLYVIHNRYNLYYNGHRVLNKNLVAFRGSDANFSCYYYDFDFVDKNFKLPINKTAPLGTCTYPDRIIARVHAPTAYPIYSVGTVNLASPRIWEYAEKLVSEKEEPLQKPICFSINAYKNSMYYIAPIKYTWHNFQGETTYKNTQNTNFTFWAAGYANYSLKERNLIPLNKFNDSCSQAERKDLIGVLKIIYSRNGANCTTVPIFFEKRVGCYKTDTPNNLDDMSVQFNKLDLN